MGSAIGRSGLPSELWSKALYVLERKHSKPVFETCLRPIRPIAMSETELILTVQSRFARDWLERHLEASICEALGDLLGRPFAVRFVVATDVGREMPEVYANLNRRYTFAEFIVANSNRFAQAASQAVAEAPARAYNPLFLYSGVGLGKTHLMHAIGHRVLSQDPRTNVVYVSSEEFTNEFIIAIKNNQTVEFRNKYRQVDVLLIDDIQFLEGKEQTQEEFFHTFNSLHEAHRQLVISSDRPPKEIATLESGLRSRFEWGLLTDIGPPDLEAREAILRRKAQSERMPVPSEVTSFIARAIPSNVRELEGALIRVVAYASLMKSQLSVELAAEVLESDAVPARRIAVQVIKERVAKAHGVTLSEMDQQRRDRRIAGPRHIAMYLACELTNESLPQIAREFQKKDHTTIMYARDKVQNQMDIDEAYRNKIRQLLALCESE